MECLVDFKTWTTNRTKVGEFEFESNDLPLIRVYKTLQTTEEHSYAYSTPGSSYSSLLALSETFHWDPADTAYLPGSDGEGCNNLVNIGERIACSGSYAWTAGTNGCQSTLAAFPTCTWVGDCYSDHFGQWPFDAGSLDDAVVSTTVEENGARRRTVETLLTDDYDCTRTYVEQLSDEYRTDELIARIRTDLDAQADPEVWGGSGSAWTSLVQSERCADAQKMVYRFRFYGETNVSYRIEWEELTRYADGTVSARPMVENVDGVGGETLSPEHIVPPPYQSATVTVENVRLSLESDDLTVNAPGTACIGAVGGNGSGILSGGGACCGPGTLEGAGRGMAFAISLGRAEYGRFAGWLGMWESDGTLDIDALRSTATRPDVEVIRPEGWVRQVKAPQVFADVVRAQDLLSFTIYLYRLGDIGPKSMGLYTTPDPTNAVASWTVSRSGVPGLLTVLTMTERRGSSERQHQYAYDRQQRIWTLDYPDDLRQDTVQLVANGSNRFYIGTVKGPGGAEVYHVEQQFEQFAWGSGLVHQQIGVGTNQLITTYTYSPGGFSAFDGMANGNAVPLEQVNFPDGRWERYVYDDDGRLTQRIGPFLNADEDAPSSECRTVAYVYQDGAGVWQPRVPRVELAKVQDWPVQRTLRDLTEFTFSEARCLDLTTTNLNATGNLLTVRRYYQAPANLKHLLQSIQLPDGTREAYFYSIQNGYQTNVVLRGQPDPASLTNVLSGTKTVISLGSFGQVLRRKVQDLQTGIVLADDQYQCTDEWLRSYQVTHLDQTVEQFQYGCCGLEQSIDRDGVATTYQYDSLRRRVETQRLAIRTTNQLDAIGNALTTVRLGTNGTDAIVLDRSAYDVGGRRYVQTNALGGVTLFSEGRDSGSGGITNRVIYPDGGVRLERRARDGSLLEASGTATHPQQFLYGIDTPGEVGPEGPMYLPFTVQINLGATGATNEWTRTYQDRFGRDYKTIYPDPTPDDLSDNPARQTWFNTKGQVWKERDPDGVVLLYGYNAKGERDYAALDLNRNDAIDFGGTDRITWTTNDVTTYSGINVRRTRMIVYTNNNSTAILTNAMTQTAVSGLKTWQTGYRDSATAATTVTESVYGTNGTRTVNVTAPDGSSSVTVHSYGRPQSVTRKDSGGAQVAQTSYQYDSHGRPWKVTDARNGTTVTTYNEADQVLTVTAPPLGTGEPAQVTRTFYDSQGRVTGTQLPDGATRTNFLAPTGLTLLTQGGRSYPVAYTYDAQGRPQTMTTWKDFAGNAGAATNQWTYDEQGRLRAKHYPDPISGAVVAGSGPVYTNSPAGRLQTRDWKRGVRTAYAYNAAGDLASVTYSDGTPGVAYTYDRRGRLATVARNGITTALTYNDANQPLTEMHSGGTLGGLSMNWAYDTSLRLTTVMAKNGANTLQSATHGYDAAGRLQSVTDSPRSAAYKYHANSLLISTVTLTNSGTAGLVSSRAYDKLDRLLSINSGTSSNGVAVAALSYGYQYNGANQRTRRIEADGTYWVYGYDALGQVVSGRRYWADGTAVAGQQFEYGFDDIGNRKSSGGRASAVGSYTNSLLNQITGRGVAPSMDVLGLANPTTNVTVGIQGGTAYTASRKGEYFHYPLTVPNTTAQYPQIDVKSLYGATQTDTGRVYVPPAGEVFQHDADGNLTQDGRWTYTWDGENRLMQMIRDIDSPTGARQKLVFEYDHQGRRIRKQFFTRSGSNWVEQRDAICLYEGWNVVAELDANVSNARLRTYVWGLDLSGTRQGAGGVGGLLWVNNDQTSYGGQTLPIGVQYVAYDGNGNVVGLAKAADGTLSARYEYGPFGETVRQTGVLADAQPFRFSTKWTDVESGFLYYGYRYYNPSTGRWLNRDPIGQRGGRQPYSFLLNDALNSWDWLGLLRKGDKLDVSYHGKKIGHVTIESYFPNPTSGKREHRKDAIMVGAQLEAVVNIDCDCPGGYKWRQFITETRGTVATKSHTLDIGNRDAKRDGEWFKEHRTDNLSSICAYTFVDAPEQAADYRLELPSSNPDRIEKVTVTFTLELVRVDTRQTKSGGEILLTIEWGFWYTASANGLLNNDPVERKPPTKALE